MRKFWTSKLCLSASVTLLVYLCIPAVFHTPSSPLTKTLPSNLSPWLVHKSKNTTPSSAKSPLANLIQQTGDMKMGVLVARMGGIDGVALETEKINEVFVKAGITPNYLVGQGQVRTPGIGSTSVNDLLSFSDPCNQAIIALCFPELSSPAKINDALNLAMQKAEEFGLNNTDVSSLKSKLNTITDNYENNPYKKEIDTVVDKMLHTQSLKVLKVLEDWVSSTGVKTVLIENSNTIPMQLPLGVATAMLAKKRPDLLFINHNHDFYWERHRYTTHMNTVISKYLDASFPLTGANVKQITINSAALKSLAKQTIAIMNKTINNAAIEASAKDTLLKLTKQAQVQTSTGAPLPEKTRQEFTQQLIKLNPELSAKLTQRLDVLTTPPTVLPNVMDYNTPSPVLDEYNSDFRTNLGLDESDFLFGNIVRIVERKSIEFTLKLIWCTKTVYLHEAALLQRNGKIEQAAKLRQKARRLKIILTGGDESIEGSAYLSSLKSYILRLGLPNHVIFLGEVPGITVGLKRGLDQKGRKIYTLEDIYANLDMVSYPSTYEGFGNALLEAIWAKLPVIVYPYKIYREDIRQFFAEDVFEYPEIGNPEFWKKFSVDLDLLKAEDLQTILELSIRRYWLKIKVKTTHKAIVKLRSDIRDYFQTKQQTPLKATDIFAIEQKLTEYGQKFVATATAMSKEIDQLMELPDRHNQIRNSPRTLKAFEHAAHNFSFGTMNSIMTKIIAPFAHKKQLTPQPQNIQQLHASA